MNDFEQRFNSILSSPEDMKKIMGLAKELESGSSAKAEAAKSRSDDAASPPDLLSDIDPRIFKAATRILGEYSSRKNDKAELIRSLKPYIRAERCRDLDRAVEIARLAGIAKLAFSEFSGGEINP